MTRKLIFVVAAALGIVWSGVSEAKVCRLGDEGCETSEFFGTGDGQCDASYKPCDNPRAGATYCYGVYNGSDTPKALYRDEDCCSALVDNGYQECSINEGKAGYGLSCLGAKDNITYWQYCGCSYGFVEVEDGVINGGVVEDILTKDIVPYESRCGEAGWGFEDCKFAQCNEERRFFFEDGGAHCKYRLGTRCGGFGCMQVYDCNHDELNDGHNGAKEYYRNENETLADGIINFIPFYGEDFVSNERINDTLVKLILATSNNDVAASLIEGVHYEDYEVVNRYVCRYELESGRKTNHDVEDNGGGFKCNSVPNYCYLWDGCNEDRRWYNSGASTVPVNAGIIYSDDTLYQVWLNTVEKDSDYHPENVHPGEIPQHLNFYREKNPGFLEYEPIPGSIDGKNKSTYLEIGGKLIDDKGCTYIRGDCHINVDEYDEGGANKYLNHRCWKKVSCTEENRFYASFMNAATISVDKDGNVLAETNNLYESSLSEPYYTGFYGLLEDPETEIYPACVYEINNCNDATGCYRKSLVKGCIDDFEDVREHLTIEDDWMPWFEYLYPLCNDSTRCYKATACDLEMGAYSSEPNTIFFQTISSTATGLTCYKGIDCYYELGAYTSEPNTSFFSAINSHATGSICYRGESCHFEAGSYSSVPNLYFFKVEESVASGSICYRGVECLGLDSGAYTSEPNTSFFNTIGSAASSSTCYRGTSCNLEAGSYSSEPNTLFFKLSDSSASGSICYRGDSCDFEIGVYSSEPNTSFFENINSLASGSTCYRGQNCNFEAGSYSSEPNTLFFDSINSLATGSTCYRGQGCDIIIGSYSSEPNTLFFTTISSMATGSTCYRGEECNFELGAYTSEPNTSFFELIDSKASGSVCYRGDACHIAAGSYSSEPNTLFFFVFSSTASGSTCYRGVECLEKDGGVYSSTPNTEFFTVISSLASGSGCYRGESCNFDSGSYSSEPSTSFFEVINSSATGSICYRGKDCHIEAGAYVTTPNEDFFNVITSTATSLTCYRGEDCNEERGSYSSEPNTIFFVAIDSIASGSTCYRAEGCAETAVSEELKNTSFFVFISSAATGSICYRSTSCRFDVGAYSSTPNTSFFNVLSSMNALQDSTCYRGGGCHIEAGAYSSAPNTSFFAFVTSEASGSVAYRVVKECPECGAYSSSPNTSFFDVITSLGSGSIAYRAQKEHIAAGSYSSEPNTSFFLNISSVASGSVAYRSELSHIAAGAYSSSPNPLFFNVIMSYSSGSISYRADRASADTIETNTSFFLGIHSLASGSIAYRSEKAHLAAGAYSSAPNTSFFYVIYSYGSGSYAYRAENTHFAAGAYTSEPNTTFFKTIYSLASGSTAYRAEDACIECGSYATSPNTSFFITTSSMASGSIAYRALDQHIIVGAYETSPNTSFFDVISSLGTSLESFRAQGAHLKAGAYSSEPNTSFFLNSSSMASGSTAYRGDIAHIKAGAYSSEPNNAFFTVDKSLASGSTCYRGAECALSAVSKERTNTSFFIYTQSEASGSTCYRSSACLFDIGAYSSSPNTSFFSVLSSTNAENDSTCYRGGGCNIPAGAYSSTPNTSFFKTTSSVASGSTSYRAEEHCPECGAYDVSPNTSFFFVISSSASGSKAYRAQNSHIAAGAYSSTPNTLFFNVISSVSSGSKSYRAESVDWLNGNYSSSPNTMFFNTISSKASGSFAYRADTARILEGAYTSAPNTSFFIFSYSHASGIYAYRGDEIHIKAGAYSSTPNTMFFNTVKSLASGTISYRADMICKANVCGHQDASGKWIPHVYTEKPNTMFFDVLESQASGSKAYRARDVADSAYSSSPNTSFFIVITSQASGSTSYRGEKSHIAAGAYSSSPNPLFFDIIVSHASGSISYRAEEANFNRGAYTSRPNTSFFLGLSSHASGSTSYRTGPVHILAGAYETSPNTSFFYVINSKASGSTSYRAESAHIKAGAYSSTPNTLFFAVIKSISSGSTAYRAKGAGGGGYSATPNTSFFNTISSKASGLTCFRGHDCRITAGSYSSTPNTLFFNAIKSIASGSTCYRGDKCSTKAKTEDDLDTVLHAPDGGTKEYWYTMFFNYTNSTASGSICYRAVGNCVYATGALTEEPNTSFFVNMKVTETTVANNKDSTVRSCYMADHCNITKGAYTGGLNSSYFVITDSTESGFTCYRGDKCNTVIGAYSSTPNAKFFKVTKSLASGKTCFRGDLCDTTVGAYSIKPNTMYFHVIESKASGTTCYRAEECQDEATNVKLSTSYFITSFSTSSGSDCYRGDECHLRAGAYTASPNKDFFNVGEETAPKIKCYRGTSCSSKASNFKNTSFFTSASISESIASGSKCYRGSVCNTAVGAYTTTPNTSFFKVSKVEQAAICYRATECNTGNGTVTDAQDNTLFFNYDVSLASGSKCYRATSCNTAAGAYSSKTYTEFFNYSTMSQTSQTCYRVTSCASSSEKIENTSYFITFDEKTRSGSTCYRGTSCHIAGGAYSSEPNKMFFNVGTETQGTTCYRGLSCGGGSYSTTTSYFNYISSTASSKKCYRATSCNEQYSSRTPPYYNGTTTDASEAFCNIKESMQNGVKCYYPDECICANPPCEEGSDDCLAGDDYNQYCKCCDAKKIALRYDAVKAQYFETKVTVDFVGVKCYDIAGCKDGYSKPSDVGCDTEYFKGLYTACGTTCGKPAPAGGCYLADYLSPSYSSEYTWAQSAKCGGLTVYYATECNAGNQSYPPSYFTEVGNNVVYDSNGTQHYFTDVFYTSGKTNACSSSGGPFCHTLCSCTNGWTKTKPSNSTYVSVTTTAFNSLGADRTSTSALISTLNGFGPDIKDGMLTSEMTPVDVNVDLNADMTSLESSKSLTASGSGVTCYQAIDCDSGFEYFSKGYDYYVANKPSAHLWLWQNKGNLADNYCMKPGCQDGYTLYGKDESTQGMSCSVFGDYKCCKESDTFCPDYFKVKFNYTKTAQISTENCYNSDMSKNCTEKLNGMTALIILSGQDSSFDGSSLSIASGDDILDEGGFEFVYDVKNVETSAVSSNLESNVNGTCRNLSGSASTALCSTGTGLNDIYLFNASNSTEEYFTTTRCSGGSSICRTFDGITGVKFGTIKTYETGDTITVTLTNGTTTKTCTPTVCIQGEGDADCVVSCPSGYYADQPDTTFFGVADTKTLSNGIKCYKVSGCKDDYPEDGAGDVVATYHGFTCKKPCPDNEYFSETTLTTGVDGAHYVAQGSASTCYDVSCNKGQGYIANGRGTPSTKYGITCSSACAADETMTASPDTEYFRAESAHVIANDGSGIEVDCYSNITCNTAAGYSSSGFNCKTWNGVECCAPCPEGYYYLTTTPTTTSTHYWVGTSGGTTNCYLPACRYPTGKGPSVSAYGLDCKEACTSDAISSLPSNCSDYRTYFDYDSSSVKDEATSSYKYCYTNITCKEGYTANTQTTVNTKGCTWNGKACYEEPEEPTNYYVTCQLDSITNTTLPHTVLEFVNKYPGTIFLGGNCSWSGAKPSTTSTSSLTLGFTGTPSIDLASSNCNGASGANVIMMDDSPVCEKVSECDASQVFALDKLDGDVKFVVALNSNSTCGVRISNPGINLSGTDVKSSSGSGMNKTYQIELSNGDIVFLQFIEGEKTECDDGAYTTPPNTSYFTVGRSEVLNNGNECYYDVHCKSPLVEYRQTDDTGSATCHNYDSGIKCCETKEKCPDGSYYYGGFSSPLIDQDIYKYTEVGGNGSGCYEVACNDTIELGVYSGAYDGIKTSPSPLLTAPAAGETASIYTEPLKTWDTIATANGIKCYLSPQPTHIVKYYEGYYSGSSSSSGDETCYNVVGVDFIRGGIERYDNNSNLFENIEAEDVSDRFTIDSIGTSKCSGGYLENNDSTNYYIEYKRSNVDKQSDYLHAIYTCDSQGRATACIDKFSDYRSNITAGLTDTTTLTPSIGNCYYSEDDFTGMTLREPEGEHSFYHSKSGKIYTGKTLTLIEQNDFTRRNAVFDNDNGFVTISVAVLKSSGTQQGYGTKTLDISYADSEVRTPEGVDLGDISLTTRINVVCSGGETGIITHVYENGGNNKPSSVQCVGSYTTAPTAEIKVDSISSSGIPYGYGLRYELKELQSAGSGKYEDLDGGIIKTPTGYGVATKSSNKWGGRCTSPLNYEPDIPVPQCPAKVTYTISYTKDSATTMKDISVKYDVAPYNNVSIYSDDAYTVRPYLSNGEDWVDYYDFADCLVDASSGSCTLYSDIQEDDGTLDVGDAYDGIGGTVLTDGDVEICVNNKLSTFCDDIIENYETTIDLGSDCPNVPVEVVIDETDEAGTCPDGYYYYANPSEEQDPDIYIYTKHTDSTTYPNCYRTQCGTVEHKLDDYATNSQNYYYYNVITRYLLSSASTNTFSSPLSTTDTTTELKCYLPKWPTHFVYRFTDDESGYCEANGYTSAGKRVYGLDFIFGATYSKNSGSTGRLLQAQEDVGYRFRLLHASGSGYTNPCVDDGNGVYYINSDISDGNTGTVIDSTIECSSITPYTITENANTTTYEYAGMNKLYTGGENTAIGNEIPVACEKPLASNLVNIGWIYDMDIPSHYIMRGVTNDANIYSGTTANKYVADVENCSGTAFDCPEDIPSEYSTYFDYTTYTGTKGGRCCKINGCQLDYSSTGAGDGAEWNGTRCYEEDESTVCPTSITFDVNYTNNNTGIDVGGYSPVYLQNVSVSYQFSGVEDSDKLGTNSFENEIGLAVKLPELDEFHTYIADCIYEGTSGSCDTESYYDSTGTGINVCYDYGTGNDEYCGVGTGLIDTVEALVVDGENKLGDSGASTIDIGNCEGIRVYYTINGESSTESYDPCNKTCDPNSETPVFRDFGTTGTSCDYCCCASSSSAQNTCDCCGDNDNCGEQPVCSDGYYESSIRPLSTTHNYTQDPSNSNCWKFDSCTYDDSFCNVETEGVTETLGGNEYKCCPAPCDLGYTYNASKVGTALIIGSPWSIDKITKEKTDGTEYCCEMATCNGTSSRVEADGCVINPITGFNYCCPDTECDIGYTYNNSICKTLGWKHIAQEDNMYCKKTTGCDTDNGYSYYSTQPSTTNYNCETDCLGLDSGYCCKLKDKECTISKIVIKVDFVCNMNGQISDRTCLPEVTGVRGLTSLGESCVYDENEQYIVDITIGRFDVTVLKGTALVPGGEYYSEGRLAQGTWLTSNHGTGIDYCSTFTDYSESVCGTINKIQSVTAENVTGTVYNIDASTLDVEVEAQITY